MAHTKGPWKAIVDPSGEAIYIRHNGYIIAKLDNRRGLGEPEANAEFIVRACNSHDDLLEALELVKRCNDKGFINLMTGWSRTVNNAIKKAKA